LPLCLGNCSGFFLQPVCATQFFGTGPPTRPGSSTVFLACRVERRAEIIFFL